MAIWKISQKVVILFLILFCSSCGAKWQGKIVYLQDGKAIIRPEIQDKIKNGQKVLIYRHKTITHPITNAVLGDINDKIGEFPVAWVRDKTITVSIPEPEFSMIMVNDQAIAARGSIKPKIGSIYEVGKIDNVETDGRTIHFTANPGVHIGAEGLLTVIKYKDIVVPTNSNEILAVAVEPVANLQVKKTDAGGKFSATYNLQDEKLDWIELDDIVVSRTGDMVAERFWFQDTPYSFDRSWLFKRNYLRGIRYYDSGLYREAILEFDDVIKADPNYKDATYLLGLCYVNINRNEEAIKQFKDILSRNPDDAKSLLALGYIYIKDGNLAEAVKLYEKLTTLIPENPELWMDIGDIYSTLGDSQKAELAYKKALETEKDKREVIR